MLSQRAFSFRSVTFNEIWHWKELLHCGEEALWNTEQLLSPEGEKKWHLENVALKKARLGLKKKKTNTRTKSPLKIAAWQLYSALLGFGYVICSCWATAWQLLFMGKDLFVSVGASPVSLRWLRNNCWSISGTIYGVMEERVGSMIFFFFFVFSHHWVINIYQPLALKSLLTIPNLNPKKSVKLLKSFSSSYEMLARIFKQEGEWDSDLNLTFNLLSSPWAHWFAVAVFYPCLLGLVLTNISSTGPCSWWCADLWKNKSCSLNPPPNT